MKTDNHTAKECISICTRFLPKYLLTAAITGLVAAHGIAQSNVADIGKSFVNISKLHTGGTFEPNDTLEIRVTFAVRNVSPSQISNVQVFDTVPDKTSYLPGSIRISTNEGITYKGPYTDAYDDADPASCVSGNILINLGSGATKSTGGIIKNTDRPSFYNSTCILVACYRIRINSTANYGDTIRLGGKVIYKINSTSYTRNFPYGILLAHSYNNACLDGLSVSAAGDSMGTFAGGITQNRVTALAFSTTYNKTNVSVNTPNDYSYAIVNNSSADGSVNSNSKMPETSPLHRVFGLWDIAGDHTGAANPAIGNPPAAPGNRGGYMVLINSSYNTDIAYKETLSNLCPGTYYEFSAWFRNLCPRCGCDSTGKGSNSVGYITGPGNDSSGVKPNISFEIDGLALYTSGDIAYDRVKPWKKFGFVFMTRSTQNTASFLIRNNSPGGGGNDWAMDDITVSHCGPSLSMNIKPVVLGCDASPFLVKLSDTVRYIFDNGYTHWQWQKSTNSGNSWSNLTEPGTSGIGIPEWVDGAYQYIANLPPFLATLADSGSYYRVIVATTQANLNSGCAYNDGSSTMIKVLHCGGILASGFSDFTASSIAGKNQLRWTVSNEENISSYEVEKSTDAIRFEKIYTAAVDIHKNGQYRFVDLQNNEGKVYYRIKMTDPNGLYKYSRIVVLGDHPSFEILRISNPANSHLYTYITAPKTGLLNIRFYDITMQLNKIISLQVTQGFNTIVTDISDLSKGMYMVSFELDQTFVSKKIIHFN